MKNPFRRNMLDSGSTLGRTLLAGWLIAFGAIPLLGLGSATLATVMNFVAITAGVCLVLHR